MSDIRLITIYSVPDDARKGAVRVTDYNTPAGLSPFLPANCQILRKLALEGASGSEKGSARPRLAHAELSCWFDSRGRHDVSLQQLHRILLDAGIKRLKPSNGNNGRDWFLTTPGVAAAALSSIKKGTGPERKSPDVKRPGKLKVKQPAKRPSHKAADALDWKEAQHLILSLLEDKRYRDCLLVATGCFLGLRISDILTLRWGDLIGRDKISLTERKTGKQRLFRINSGYARIIGECAAAIYDGDPDAYIFESPDKPGFPITRQRADQLLKECKARYGLKSAETFSTHSLRKSFGRRVWLNQCEKGEGERALLLLCDVFGHSSIAITKRYLGIRQDEILSVYDKL